MKCFLGSLSRRGSALLIVLGFLSFMMVSAVSFAIYMRIERQASSNYRHAITARHMLNSALYRAIDEIDSELRIEKVNNEAEARPRKFPEWPGRTKPSAVPNGLDNGQESRVLSMEALSFIPGILVNDVRRYAVSNQYDSVSGISATKASYLGTKWRTLSMPVSSLGTENSDAINAYEEAIVGRYSYLCINVSDMLDVNVCKAAVRNAETNRVSLGILFGRNSQPEREKFDAYVENKGLRFETLQDFYTCMFSTPAASPDPNNPSPYHEYLKAGNATDADAGFDEAVTHAFITDAIAKAQPANATACNILLQPPISEGSLGIPQTPTVSFQNTPLNGRDGFETALGKAFAGRLPNGANLSDVFPLMLADYIDKDNTPKSLNTPSVELVPMVSQILVSPLFKPRIMEEVDAVQPNPPPPQPVKTFWLNAVPIAGPAVMQVQVELACPYKRLKDRKCPLPSTYEVEVLAYLRLHTTAKQSDGFQEQPSAATGYLKLSGQANVPVGLDTKDDENQNECYKTVMVTLSAVGGVTRLDFAKNVGNVPNPIPGYQAPNPVMVSLVVSARVKGSNGLYVDSAPQGALPCPKFGGLSDDLEFATVTPNKLYFQTTPMPFVPATETIGAGGKELTYAWTSLEVPDPRFNYKAANWIKNDNDGSAGQIPDNVVSPKTLALLGKNGRDGDIFMSVSDTGKLLSPGELGFIVRPFKYDMLGSPVDFSTRTDVDPSVDDSAAYFRTVRLYDHDNDDASDKITRAKDPIYQYFTAQSADGSVPGARVNPLSDLPVVLSAAIDQTPAEYWFASLDSNSSSDLTKMRDNTFNKFLSVSDWGKVTNAWAQCLMRLRTTPQGKQMKTTWKYGLPDYYGDFDKFGWYSADDSLSIFKPKGFAPSGVPASLSKPLHEIDRKMLYSFSLDSFSDRQQLFLYVLRAEVTVPSFGSSKESGTKSLAGGRAVALVWRDPYPEGYDKDSDTWLKKNWYDTNPKRMSPWYQVNIDQYDSEYEAYDIDKSFTQRLDGFHQHKILFFKQLDN